MKIKLACVILMLLSMVIYPSCKKKKDSSVPGSIAFVDSLKAQCTAVFTGQGDSSNLCLPTAFSPNSDGLNDFYGLIGTNVSPSYFSSYSMKIYDTTGKLIYQSSTPSSIRWGGEDQTTGVESTNYKFYVKIKYTTAGGKIDSGSTFVYRLTGTPCLKVVIADTASYKFPTQFSLSTGYHASWPSSENYCP